jgi:glutamyl-tRNA synthetase
MTNEEIANLIFPEITTTLKDLEVRYPSRNLPITCEVTRFAPSPTGFLHTGSLFTSMICHKLANQTKGIFYVRLEDTDTKREIEGSGVKLLNELKEFGIVPNEGYLGDNESGAYGPYTQSKRADIYKVAIKHLLSIGRAYPCFCTIEELNEIRKTQEANKVLPGYYGKYAKCRFINNEERERRIKNGDPFVIRFLSQGNHNNKTKVHDLIHGDISIAENDQDIVIYKGDGLPTYHFAHVVDDHFMRTTTVIRGEEWISSLPIHIELFSAMNWNAPKYAHVPVIMKIDENGNKRKLSKRKDPEAACSFFLDAGYPAEALTMYLMTIANSNFEEWIFANNFKNMNEFIFSFDKVSTDGALFDLVKVNFFAREILARKTKEEILDMAYDYASRHNEILKILIDRNPKYFMEIMNIERDSENPRKDYSHFGELPDAIGFFYDDIYKKQIDVSLFNPNINKEIVSKILEDAKDLDTNKEQSEWFADVKEIAKKNGFAESNKIYKANKEAFLGHVGDVAEIIRITLTARRNSPNLYFVMKVLGKDTSTNRFDYVISLLK